MVAAVQKGKGFSSKKTTSFGEKVLPIQGGSGRPVEGLGEGLSRPTGGDRDSALRREPLLRVGRIGGDQCVPDGYDKR